MATEHASGGCLFDEELLPFCTGEPVASTHGRHLANCPHCRERLERLRAEVHGLRTALGEQEIAPT